MSGFSGYISFNGLDTEYFITDIYYEPSSVPKLAFWYVDGDYSHPNYERRLVFNVDDLYIDEAFMSDIYGQSI